MNLTAEQQIALAKAVASKASLTAGEYPVDFAVLVRVSGKVTKGEDYEQTIHASADGWKIAMLALSKLNGVTIESLVRESLESDLDTKEVVSRANAAAQTIKEATKTICSGKTTAKVNVTIEEAPSVVTRSLISA